MKSQVKKIILLVSALVMLTVVMCFGVSAASTVCPDTISGDHIWWSREIVNVTCEEDGYNRMVCYYCGDEKIETYPAFGGSCDFALTETYPCSEEYLCKNCNTVKFTVTDSSKHDLDPETGDTIDATCTADGYSYLECDYCNTAVLTATYPARGYHAWEKCDENGDVGSCSPDYWEELYCYDCGASKIVTGATTGHNWVRYTEYGTCYSYLEYYCNNYNCSETKIEKNLNPSEHSIDSWEIKYATCTEEGLMGYGCVECPDVSYTEIIPATGHTYLYDWAEILPPSCTGQGVKIKVCNDCSFVAHETIDSLGHTDIDADEICDICSLALSEKADAEDKTEEENPTEAPDEAPEENPDADDSVTADTSVAIINRLLSFFERIMQFFEKFFGLIK